MTDVRSLPEKTLAYVLEQLERKLAALKFTTTTGARLLQQYQDKVGAVRVSCWPAAEPAFSPDHAS